MCRIYGYLAGRPLELAEKMMQVARIQLHGGPDSQNFYATPQCGIGANRLAITDLHGGAQPYNSIPGIYAVLNGEIYNHEELRKLLQDDGYIFPDRCDGTIIPALYSKYGRSFAEYIDGMFTIAILDLRKPKPELILVSDSSGIKPVYYCYNPEKYSFAFATEIPGLLQFGLVSNEIWREGIDHYLTSRAVTGNRTLLKNVYSLPPGHILKITVGEELHTYEYQSRIKYNGHIPKTSAEASEILRSLLTEEVRKLSIADTAICSVNSGGLDSSLLTSILSQHNNQKTHSFHVSCEGNWPHDERQYAKELADQYGLIHHEVFIRPEDIPTLIPKMIFHLGQPNCAPHALSTYRLFEAVSNKGFKIAMTGEGSDELFCGHDRMIRAVNSESLDWASSYLDQMSPCDETLRQSLYSQEYINEMNLHNGTAKTQLLSQLITDPDMRSETIRKFEQKNSLSYYILQRVEPLAMASAVEVRVPFCQPKIMDFSRIVKPEFLLSNNNKGKAIVYGAAKGLLPESIWNRPKQPFTLPIISLMHKGSALMNFTKDVLLSKSMMDNSIFKRNTILSIIQKQEDSPSKHYAFTLWALLTYAVWQEMLYKGFEKYEPISNNDNAIMTPKVIIKEQTKKIA